MAQRVEVKLVDDMDGTSVAEETIKYALDGASYEIDLNPFNAEKLRDALEPFIACSRKIKGGSKPRPHRSVPTSGHGLTRGDRDDVREFAKSRGWEVGDRGRVKDEYVEAWRAAGSPRAAR